MFYNIPDPGEKPSGELNVKRYFFICMSPIINRLDRFGKFGFPQKTTTLTYKQKELNHTK